MTSMIGTSCGGTKVSLKFEPSTLESVGLGQDALADAKEQRPTRAIAILLESGLVELTGDYDSQASETIFRDRLSRQPKRQPKGHDSVSGFEASCCDCG